MLIHLFVYICGLRACSVDSPDIMWSFRAAYTETPMLRICIFMKLLNSLYSSSSVRTDLSGWLVFTCFGGSLICYVVVMEILHRTGHEIPFSLSSPLRALFSDIFYPRFSLSLSSLYVSRISLLHRLQQVVD